MTLWFCSGFKRIVSASKALPVDSIGIGRLSPFWYEPSRLELWQPLYHQAPLKVCVQLTLASWSLSFCFVETCIRLKQNNDKKLVLKSCVMKQRHQFEILDRAHCNTMQTAMQTAPLCAPACVLSEATCVLRVHTNEIISAYRPSPFSSSQSVCLHVP